MKIQWYRVVAIWEVIVGIVGVYLTFTAMVLPSQDISRWIFLYVVFIGLYALCSISGLLLWQKKPAGVNLSLIVQFLLMPKIILTGLVYYFSSIFYIPVGFVFNSTQLAVNGGFNWGLAWRVGAPTPNENYQILIDIIALVMFIYLLGNRKRLTTAAPAHAEEALVVESM